MFFFSNMFRGGGRERQARQEGGGCGGSEPAVQDQADLGWHSNSASAEWHDLEHVT